MLVSVFVQAPSFAFTPVVHAVHACMQVHEVEAGPSGTRCISSGRGEAIRQVTQVWRVWQVLWRTSQARGEAAAGGEQGRAATKALGKRKRGAAGQCNGEGSAEAPLGAEISRGRGRKKVRVTGGDDVTDEEALVQAAVASQGGGSVASSGDPKFDAVLDAAAAFCLSLA